MTISLFNLSHEAIRTAKKGFYTICHSTGRAGSTLVMMLYRILFNAVLATPELTGVMRFIESS